MMSPFAVFVFLLGLSSTSCVNFTTVYEWGIDEIDYLWPTEANKTAAHEGGSYIPSRVELYYLAVYKERLFISIYKYEAIPVTLVSLPTSSASSDPPKLAPFPSWQLHEKDRCDCINEARGLEVDPDGRLWVLDEGSLKCSPKIWIIDLENKDKIELVHTFSEEAVHPVYGERRLNDMVLDKTPDDTFAFIVDPITERIIAFSLKKNQSWSLQTPGRNFASLALSPRLESRQLYLGRVFSRELYAVPVAELRARTESASLKLIGEWTEMPMRMLVDDSNVLYAAFWDASYISTWNVSEPFSERKFYETGPLEAGMTFTFALDVNGTLWMTQRNETNNQERPSHKLLKTELGTKSYLYGAAAAALESNEKSNDSGGVVKNSFQGPVSVNILVCLVRPCNFAGNEQISDSKQGQNARISIIIN